MQKQLDRLKSEVALSPLSIELEQQQILGPLGYLLHALTWGVGKLFVIR